MLACCACDGPGQASREMTLMRVGRQFLTAKRSVEHRNAACPASARKRSWEHKAAKVVGTSGPLPLPRTLLSGRYGVTALPV